MGDVMGSGDEWGRDPSVQMMRKVFNRMETAQDALLNRLSVSTFDPRLRPWREKALALFEPSWGRASRLGVGMDQETAAGIYMHCLAQVIRSEGLEIPTDALPENRELDMLLKEVMG